MASMTTNFGSDQYLWLRHRPHKLFTMKSIIAVWHLHCCATVEYYWQLRLCYALIFLNQTNLWTSKERGQRFWGWAAVEPRLSWNHIPQINDIMWSIQLITVVYTSKHYIQTTKLYFKHNWLIDIIQLVNIKYLSHPLPIYTYYSQYANCIVWTTY